MALQKEQVKFSEIPIFATEVQWVLLVSFTMLKDKKLDSKQFCHRSSVGFVSFFYFAEG